MYILSNSNYTDDEEHSFGITDKERKKLKRVAKPTANYDVKSMKDIQTAKSNIMSRESQVRRLLESLKRTGNISSEGRKALKAYQAPKDMNILPKEILSRVALFADPVNRVAMRQTSKFWKNSIPQYSTKKQAENQIRKSLRDKNRAPVLPFSDLGKNRFMMSYQVSDTGRKFMHHNDARRFLKEVLLQKGNRDLFGIVFPGMYGAKPTNVQRLAIAKGITDDKSLNGTKFMMKLVRKLISRGAVLPPQVLASVSTKGGRKGNRTKVF